MKWLRKLFGHRKIEAETTPMFNAVAVEHLAIYFRCGLIYNEGQWRDTPTRDARRARVYAREILSGSRSYPFQYEAPST